MRQNEDDPYEPEVWELPECDEDPDWGRERPTKAALKHDPSYEDGGHHELSDLIGFSHHGELWLGDGGYVLTDGCATIKAKPTVVEVCSCGWPLPIRWGWSACEFGEPRAWPTTDPEAEPWAWTLCRCNGCVGLPKLVGRPPEDCTKCAHQKKLAQRRHSYVLKSVINSQHYAAR